MALARFKAVRGCDAAAAATKGSCRNLKSIGNEGGGVPAFRFRHPTEALPEEVVVG